MSLRRKRPLATDPMRRPIDRWESGVLVALLVVLAVAGPAVGFLAARLTYPEVAAAAAHERATHVRTTATVLENPGTRAATSESMWAALLVRVKARWTASEGTAHTGFVTVGSTTTAGAEVRLWTDERGEPATPPRSVNQARAVAGWSGVMGVLAVGLALLATARLTRWIFDRRRLELWEREWRAHSAATAAGSDTSGGMP
jgi:hypothetical protein